MKNVLSPPAICTIVRSKACQIRRSLSRNSIDVKGAFVLEKVWSFEGEDSGHVSGSQDNLSESEEAKDAWCSKHCWILSTNLLTAHSCARCCKRILPKRAVYKCAACKRLCHLKCAAEPSCATQLDGSINTPIAEGVLSRNQPVEETAARDMNFQAFVVHNDGSPLQTCKFVRKESPKRHYGKETLQRLEVPKQNGETEYTEGVDSLDGEVPYDPSVDKHPVNNGQNGELHKSQTKQRIFNFKHNIVKRCRSIQKKVKNIRDKSLSSEEKPTVDEEQPSSMSTSTSSGDPEKQASHDSEAWARSPVRTRLRTRQLELRRESMRAKMHTRKRLDQDQEGSVGPSFWKSGRHYPACDKALDGICDRLDVVEQRVCKLETSIPQEIAEWKKLQRKFQMDVFADNANCQDQCAERPDPDTHPKRFEAERPVVLTSSGTTSDEIYVVPEYPSIESHDLSGQMVHSSSHMGHGLGHMIQRSDAIGQKETSVMYSPIASNNDSLPSGLHNKLLLSVKSNRSEVYSDHQTSTPVTAREISFRSASRNYEKTHQIKHTNVTTISIDHSYSQKSPDDYAPVKSVLNEQNCEFEKGTKLGIPKFECLDDVDGACTGMLSTRDKYTSDELKVESVPRASQEKVLSPEQLAVKSFLSKRSGEQQRLIIHNQQNRPERQSVNLCQSANTEFPDLQSPGIVRQLISHYTSRGLYSPSGKCSSFNQSPPIASSTFQQGSDLNSSQQSPSFTFRHDPEASHYSFAKIDHEESNSDHRKQENSASKNASSRSDLSHTFVLRNDSQMIHSNASEDLPGYTRNHSFHVGSALGGTGPTYNDDSSSECMEIGNQLEVKAVIETDAPREFDRPVKCEQRPSAGSLSKDCMSLTNVTELTGDYLNSFADVRETVENCEVVDKFQRDRFRTASAGKIDETGDGRKPPCDRKYNNYVPYVDFLKEAKKHLETFRKRRSGEADAGITLEKLPRIPLSVGDNLISVGGNGTCAYVGTSNLPEKTFDFLTKESRADQKSNFENAATKNGYGPRETLDQLSITGKTNLCTKQVGEKPVDMNKATRKNSTNDCHLMVDSTKEFEDIEKQLQEQLLASKDRISLSLTHLPSIDSITHEQSHRQKSFSCTNSIDGDARSLLNDGARYHFLHDKGMIKISSPSLKLLCDDQGNAQRKSRAVKYNHIDEESDIAESESESEMSGVYYVDSKFQIPGLNYCQTSSEIDSRQSKSDRAFSEMTEMTPSKELDENRQLELENHHFEEMLKYVDAHQKDMDPVVSWINNRYDDEVVEEYEHELEMLMKEQRGLHSMETEPENLESQLGSDSNLQSPDDDSVYYSVLGQSQELKNVLSPGRLNKLCDPGSELGELCAGLMNVIHHGSVQDVADLLNSDRTISEQDIKEATLWALEQENFDITMLLLTDICKLICAAEEGNCVDVFPAYRQCKRWKPIFVILTKQNFQGEWDSFMGFPVYRRRYDLVSSEAAMVVNSVFVRKHPLTVADFKTVKNVLSSEDLHKQHRNITVINACSCRSKKNGDVLEKGVCIVIHCLIKGFIPFDEEPFPNELSGIPVDVREGCFRLGVGTPIGESNTQWDTSLEDHNDSEGQSSESSSSLGTRSGTKSASGSRSQISGSETRSGSTSTSGSKSQISGSETRSGSRSVSGSRSQISGSETRSVTRPENVTCQSSSSVSDQSNSRSYCDTEEKEEEEIKIKGEKKVVSKNSSPDSNYSMGSFKKLPPPRKLKKVSTLKKTKNGNKDNTYETDSDIVDLVAKACAMGPGADVMLQNNEVLDKGIRLCGQGDTPQHTSLLIGSNIGLVGGARRGTLGGFVVLPGGGMGFITAGHVVKTAGNGEGAKVCVFEGSQTSSNGDWYMCGEVVQSVQAAGAANTLSVDVGVVRITSRHPLEAGFISVPEQVWNNAGFCNNIWPNFEKGDILSWAELRKSTDQDTEVLKCGAKTGVTMGQIYTECSYVHQEGYQNCLDNQKITLLHQLEILGPVGSPHGFFQAGDSGSLVFVAKETGLQCVAMAIGYTSYGSCIATPIEAALEAVGPGVKFVDFTLLQSSS